MIKSKNDHKIVHHGGQNINYAVYNDFKLIMLYKNDILQHRNIKANLVYNKSIVIQKYPI